MKAKAINSIAAFSVFMTLTFNVCLATENDKTKKAKTQKDAKAVITPVQPKAVNLKKNTQEVQNKDAKKTTKENIPKTSSEVTPKPTTSGGGGSKGPTTISMPPPPKSTGGKKNN